jgi:hypothetical protein
MVFNANGNWSRRYELSKQLQDIDVALLSSDTNSMRGSSFQIMTFIGLTSSWEEKAFPITV